MYYVVEVMNFDYEAPLWGPFEEYRKACAFLHWLWEDYYNREIAEGSSALDQSQCFHDEDYAKVAWVDGDQTEFILTFETNPPKEFENVDWEKYAPKEAE